jgi:hypothetical protein
MEGHSSGEIDVLSWYLSGGTEENHEENLDQNLNPGPPDY